MIQSYSKLKQTVQAGRAGMWEVVAADPHQFEVSKLYTVSFRPVRGTSRFLVSKQTENQIVKRYSRLGDVNPPDVRS